MTESNSIFHLHPVQPTPVEGKIFQTPAGPFQLLFLFYQTRLHVNLLSPDPGTKCIVPIHLPPSVAKVTPEKRSSGLRVPYSLLTGLEYREKRCISYRHHRHYQCVNKGADIDVARNSEQIPVEDRSYR